MLMRQINLAEYLLGGEPYGRRVLDFGCGYGYWCQTAKAFGFSVFGTEIDDVSRSHALSMNIQLVDFTEENNENFDFINPEQVFEHLERPLAILEMLSRHLNPGGFMRISVPNAQYIEEGIRNGANWYSPKKTKYKWGNKKRDLNPIVPIAHINGFTQHSLRKMAEKVDLTPYQIPFAEYIRVQRTCGSLRNVVRDALRHSLSGNTEIYLRKPLWNIPSSHDETG